MSNELVILFADVCGSTQMYEQLGDQQAREKLAFCIDLLGDITTRHGGKVVKTIGDEIMCTFPRADVGTQAAWAMQESVSAADGPGLDIKVGFHYGPVIEEGNDVYGDAVNVAARIVSLSKARQILTTAATVEEMSEDQQMVTRMVDRTTVKGKQEVIGIFELLWENDESDLTCMPTDVVVGETPAGARLELRFDGSMLELDGKRFSASMGRGQQNDVVIADSMASRAHASIELRRGKFILTDKSTNGTYVALPDGKKYVLRREEFPLFGEGLIGLGREPEADAPWVIRFVCS